MKDRTFASWAAPAVGAIVGGIFAARALRRDGQDFSIEWVVAGAAVGFVAGIVVWILDPRGSATSTESDTDAAPLASEAGLVGRFLSVLSILLFWVPAVGLGLGLIALLVNLRTTGWPRKAAFAGTALSTCATIAAVVLVLSEGGV